MKKTILSAPLANSELTGQARAALKGKWFTCAFILAIITLTSFSISFASEFILSGIQQYLFDGAVYTFFNIFCTYAYLKYCGVIAKEQETPSFLSCMKISFKRFAVALLASYLAGLIAFLKLFLLIIPGIIAFYDYSMVFFVAFDNRETGICDCLKMSKRLMYGHRWQLFRLSWRFFGWGILCLFTLGIGFFWLFPYTMTSMWKFYYSLIPDSDTPEQHEMPEIKPYNGMSLAARVFWLAVFFLLGVFNAYRADKHANIAVNLLSGKTSGTVAASK